MQRLLVASSAALVVACGPLVSYDDAGGDTASSDATAASDEGSPDTLDGGDDRPSDEVGEVGGEVGGEIGGDPDTGVSPSCGDGIVDAGELCDDGNDQTGDGCEPDCTVSPGIMLWSQSFDADTQNDAATAVAVTPDGEVLVVGRAEFDGNDDVWLDVLTSDGKSTVNTVLDLGADEIGTAIAVMPDGTAYVVGLQPDQDLALLMRVQAGQLIALEGAAPTDIIAFIALASVTAEGFVVITHGGGFPDLAATARRFDGNGSMIADVVTTTGTFVSAATPSVDGGTILAGTTFGGMDMESSVWLGAFGPDGSAGWSSSSAVPPDDEVRIRGLATAPDGRIVGVGSRGLGGPGDDNESGWIRWWSADGSDLGENAIDIGGAAASPSSVVVGAHGLVIAGSTVSIDDGFVVGVDEAGKLQWGYALVGDLGAEDGVVALARVPGVGIAAAGWLTQEATGQDAWVGMFTD